MPDTAGLGDLWIRASRLRESCDLIIETVATPPGWQVVIRLRGSGDVQASGTAGHLLEALAVAVNRAEAMGLVRVSP